MMKVMTTIEMIYDFMSTVHGVMSSSNLYVHRAYSKKMEADTKPIYLATASSLPPA